MKRFLLANLVLAFLLALPAIAEAQAPTAKHKKQYARAFAKARHDFGVKAVGCDLLGGKGSCHIKATDADIVKSLGVIARMYAPPPVVVSSVATSYQPASDPSQATAYTSSVSYTSSSGGCGGDTPYSGGGQCWAIPYSIVSCESGGQNVPNSQGSGAQGYYQLMSGGGGSRSEQDAAAHALWNGGAGAGNWVCKG